MKYLMLITLLLQGIESLFIKSTLLNYKPFKNVNGQRFYIYTYKQRDMYGRMQLYSHIEI